MWKVLPPDSELPRAVPMMLQPWTELHERWQLIEENFYEKEDGAGRDLKKHWGVQPGPLRLQPAWKVIGVKA